MMEKHMPYPIAAVMTVAERRVLSAMQAGKFYTAGALSTTGRLLNELWDFRRQISGARPPIMLVFRDRSEPEGTVIWELTDLGRQVQEWVRLLSEKIDIGGRAYQRLIPYPATVSDGTLRCIRCGQIDEEPWHDRELCVRALADDSTPTPESI